jgi:hypothetical protein
MRRKRTIYFDDARHYYLYVFDPPMTLEEAWVPIDQIAGTGVDTFIYGVACGGVFYPSKVVPMFGEDWRPFTVEYSAAYWRAWTNMQSLISRGLDPLKVLIDRAHEKGLDFFASVRIGDLKGIDPSFLYANGGRGFNHQEVRDHNTALLRELSAVYEVEGLELDFTADPLGQSNRVRPEDAAECMPLMNEFVHGISDTARSRNQQMGARVFPTEQMNLNAGMDVRTWLKEGWVDSVTPMFYVTMVQDPDLPFDWVIEAAHEHDVSVYPMIQPDFRDENRRFHIRTHASPEMFRAAAANFIDRGADGLYTWFLPWPMGHSERQTLREMNDPQRLNEGDKHYYVRRGDPDADRLGYKAALPLPISGDKLGQPHTAQFYVSDDLGDGRHCYATLRINIFDHVTADKLEIRLNGESLADEPCKRSPSTRLEPYYGQWLEFTLLKVRPQKGVNVLEFTLHERPRGLEAGIRVEDIELILQYGPYPTGLKPPLKT